MGSRNGKPAKRAPIPLTDHVLPDVRHGVKLLLTDLAGELLLGVAVDDLVVLVQRPQLFEGLAARHALWEEKKKKKRQRLFILGSRYYN